MLSNEVYSVTDHGRTTILAKILKFGRKIITGYFHKTA